MSEQYITRPKANKEHICNGCLEPIAVGEFYWRCESDTRHDRPECITVTEWPKSHDLNDANT